MTVLAAVLLASSLANAAPSAAPLEPPKSAPRAFTHLKAGVYECDLKGLVCAACASAISEMMAQVPGVEQAEVDFERGLLTLTVRRRATVSVTSLRRALQRASRKIDLGAGFALGEIRYVP